MNIRQISVSTPEVLWHGGGNENGKPDPVYSVDFHPQEEIMCTSGIDANVPPKGSVRVWRVSSHNSDQEFLIDLCDHQSAINVAKFSPDGKMLASASERQIVVYIVPDPSSWLTVADIAPLERIWLRPSLNEVFDMQWSPDSTHLIVGAIDCKAEIIRISTRDSVILPGHSSYIQGVAWDPLGEHVVTQSADRSCKVHKIKSKPGSTVKLAGKGHVVMRMQLGYSIPDAEKKVLTAADFGVQDGAAPTEATPTAGQTNVNLFADSFVPSFFRRISWSPDGALIIAPTGIHRPIEAKTGTAGLPGSSYCTHIFSRANLSSPCVSLAGLEEPSVAVRCCPRPYRLVSHAGQDTPAAMIPGEYRLVFAVVTLGSVFVYDTQHSHPIAKFSGLHYAPINDAAWSADGRMLAVCSSDGYLSFFRFEEGALGQLLCEEDIPVQIKRAHPCMFHYTPPAIEAPTVNAPTSTTTELNTKQTHSSEEDNINTTVSVVPSVDVIPVAPVLVVPADAAVVADFTADTKKRKRIQPVVVGALGSATSAAPVDAAVSTASPILSSPSAKPCPSQSPPVPVSAKKRIVPQLVQPASNNSPLPADSSDKTTGVSTSTSITITTPTTTSGSGDGTDQKQVSS